MTIQKEMTFFHTIAPKTRELVRSFDGNAAVAVHKNIGDYATEVDVAVENLIVDLIRKTFPGDLVLAEEGYSDAAIPDTGRIWVIDPICGTSNIGRGIVMFCTNIALIDNGELVAACVVDHSQEEYLWSVGNQQVWVNDRQVVRPENSKEFGYVIDVDMGCLGKTDATMRKRYTDCLGRLIRQRDYDLTSYGTSLGFAYVASGKLDGFINVSNKLWDIAASSFLIQQAGGVITDIDGAPWTATSQGAIAALNPAIHADLVRAYTGNK